jgi:hypothetical protein
MIVAQSQAVAVVIDATPVGGILKMLLKPKMDAVFGLMYGQGIVLETGRLEGAEMTEEQASSVLVMAASACKIDTQPLIPHIRPTLQALHQRGYVLTSIRKAAV